MLISIRDGRLFQRVKDHIRDLRAGNIRALRVVVHIVQVEVLMFFHQDVLVINHHPVHKTLCDRVARVNARVCQSWL